MVCDINFLARTLAVRRQVQRGGAGAREVRAPKYGSERTSFLADGLLEMLSQHTAIHRPGSIPHGGCSKPARASFRTRTRPSINGAEHAGARTSPA